MNNYYSPYYYPQQQPQQIQNGGFMVVPNEDIVLTYPVEPGKCVTFKIEGKPLVIEKSRGFSQFEEPRFERYKLVKEDAEITQPFDIRAEIDGIWKEINALKEPKKATRKKEIADDPE